MFMYVCDILLSVPGCINVSQKIKLNTPSLVIFKFNQKKLMRYVNVRYANMYIHNIHVIYQQCLVSYGDSFLTLTIQG